MAALEQTQHDIYTTAITHTHTHTQQHDREDRITYSAAREQVVLLLQCVCAYVSVHVVILESECNFACGLL